MMTEMMAPRQVCDGKKRLKIQNPLYIGLKILWIHANTV